MRVNINTCPCVNISPCLLGTGSRASFLLSLEATEVDKGRWDILLPLNCSERKCSSPYIYPSSVKSLMTLQRQYNDLFPLGGRQSILNSYTEFKMQSGSSQPSCTSIYSGRWQCHKCWLFPPSSTLCLSQPMSTLSKAGHGLQRS